MSLWFASAAILPDMVRESGIDAVRQAMLSSGVQLGFVAGALAVAASGLADRFDPQARVRDLRRAGRAVQRRAAGRADRWHDRHPAAVSDRPAAGGRVSRRHEDRRRLGHQGPRLAGRTSGRRAHRRIGAAASRGLSRRRGLAQRDRCHLCTCAHRRIAGPAVRPRAPSCAGAALLDARHRARLDQPAHPPHLSRLFRPYVGALRHVGVGRRGGGRVLWRAAGRSGGDAPRQAHRLPCHRARRPHLRAGRLGRRPHRQGAGDHHRHGAQRLGRDRDRAHIRRADLADLRPHRHLGNLRDPGFGAVLRAGRRCLAARPRRQRDDPADRARLRAHRGDGAGDAAAGERIRLARECSPGSRSARSSASPRCCAC